MWHLGWVQLTQSGMTEPKNMRKVIVKETLWPKKLVILIISFFILKVLISDLENKVSNVLTIVYNFLQ